MAAGEQLEDSLRMNLRHHGGHREGRLEVVAASVSNRAVRPSLHGEERVGGAEVGGRMPSGAEARLMSTTIVTQQRAPSGQRTSPSGMLLSSEIV